MQLYNTLTRQKEDFVPVTPGEVKMYVCGPTVYNFFHIGNARAFVVFDTLRRYFEYLGFDVTYIQNFTDIDDKMIMRANVEKTTVDALAEQYINEYYKDADALNIERASLNPRATKHIPEMIELVQRLVDKGNAYVADNGDVYFDTTSFKDYGKLSGQSLDDLMDGARVDTDDAKRNSADFVLWKAYKEGEPFWESPWGKGRPGWHLECSAMSTKYLGETFDIHGGGVDLTFPHHENEIAQSECATGHPFVHYWLHNGYINVDNKKMSKSAGNFFTVRDILKEYEPQVVRMFLLSSQYRTPMNFSQDLLEQNKSSYERIKNLLLRLDEVEKVGISGEATVEFREMVAQHANDFLAEMNDDINTAGALGCLFSLVRDCNVHFNDEQPAQEAKIAREKITLLLYLLGLELTEEEIPQEVNDLVEKRNQARANKDWAQSDTLRDQIEALGYTVEDSKDGTIIKKL